MKKRLSGDFALEFPYAHGMVRLRRQGRTLLASLQYQGAYGLGEKFDCFNHKGCRVVNQVEEKFCFQGGKTYCPAPFFWTDTGFGLYLDTCETTVFTFGEKEILAELPCDADVVAFSGSPETIVREYMELFG